MANKVALNFALHTICDGTSTTVTADTATSPFGFQPSGSLPVVNGAVSSLIPSAATNLTCSAGVAVTATHLLGLFTFTFATAPAAGAVDIYGTFEY
jgi:hypothetical protein